MRRKGSIRPLSVAVAVFAGAVLAPILTLQSYMYDVFHRIGLNPRSWLTDVLSVLACGLVFTLYPLVGFVYALMERNQKGQLISKVIGAAISVILVIALQVGLGQLLASYLGVDPSAGSRAGWEISKELYGVLFYPLILIGSLMLLGILSSVAAVPVIIFEFVVVRGRLDGEAASINSDRE